MSAVAPGHQGCVSCVNRGESRRACAEGGVERSKERPYATLAHGDVLTIPPCSNGTISPKNNNSIVLSFSYLHTIHSVITCPSLQATLHSPCQCSANVQQALVGNVACGPPLSADGSAESMASLSASLCNEYSGAQLKWQNVSWEGHDKGSSSVQLFL